MSTGKAVMGYTMVEIIIVVTVMSILTVAALGWGFSTFSATQMAARDSEREQDANSIALLLEQYYRSDTGSARGTYPIRSDALTDVKELAADDGILRAPGQSSDSLSGAADGLTSEPIPRASIALNQYVYQPFTRSDALCVSYNVADPCVRFNLYYVDERSDSVQTIESGHQQ